MPEAGTLTFCEPIRKGSWMPTAYSSLHLDIKFFALVEIRGATVRSNPLSVPTGNF